jgi:hypothetical protein
VNTLYKGDKGKDNNYNNNNNCCCCHQIKGKEDGGLYSPKARNYNVYIFYSENRNCGHKMGFPCVDVTTILKQTLNG